MHQKHSTFHYGIFWSLVFLFCGVSIIGWKVYGLSDNASLLIKPGYIEGNTQHRFSSWPYRSSVRNRIHPDPNWLMDSSELFRDPQPVAVPNAYPPEDQQYFEVRFERDKVLGGHAFLKIHFLAVNSPFKAYVNSFTEGHHSANWLSYQVRIPRKQLRVSNTLTMSLAPESVRPTNLVKAGAPFESCRGVVSEVVLETLPALYLDKVRYDANYLEKSVEIRVWGEISGTLPEDAKLEVEVDLFPRIADDEPYSVLNGGVRVKKGSNKFKLWLRSDKFPLWSPESPVIHDMVVSLKREEALIDDMEIPIGLRSLELIGDHVLINGTRVKLEGITVFNSNIGGCPADYPAMEKAVQRLKADKVAVVRLAQPAHPYFLDLLDSEGILAIEELPIGPLHEGISLKDASAMMREMINRDFYHPSIIGWGAGEFSKSYRDEPRAELVRKLVDVAKKLDKRPVYVVSRTPFENMGEFNADIMGYVVYPWNDPDNITAQLEKSYPGKAKLAITPSIIEASFESKSGRFEFKPDWPLGSAWPKRPDNKEQSHGWLFLAILVMWGYLLARPWLKHKLDESDVDEDEDKRFFDGLSSRLVNIGVWHSSFSAASVIAVVIVYISCQEKLWWALSPYANQFPILFKSLPKILPTSDIGLFFLIAAISGILSAFSNLVARAISRVSLEVAGLRTLLWISLPYILSLLAVLVLNDFYMATALFVLGYISKKLHQVAVLTSNGASRFRSMVAAFTTTVVLGSLLLGLLWANIDRIKAVAGLLIYT